MPLDSVADSQVVCDCLPVSKFEIFFESARASCHIVRARVYVATISDGGSEYFDVMFSNSFGVCEDLGYSFWDSNFVDTEVWIRRDHRATRKVYTLSGKVPSESALFPLESLTKTPHWFLTHLRRNTWQFGIDIHRNRYLEKFPLFLAKVVRRTNQRRDTGRTCHELGDWSTFCDPLFYECVCENYLCEFDSDVVLV